ncbi:PaaX family transcriptional regulator [Mycolicibacterium sp. BiH015]|uniref:PaaX family transcriptional regulator n=1 Tax=Mycolicibacterium sp. BiH015 TaxID=3018808 RepID=UPI0022E4990C|nr:PaaX family transcriptional regulator C-terminal domain-containing protein [Mycolicibacterium sp. BiH015]MDA2893263.1 PaaX family transcriptional regulator [Mycolicibacterium sp. BiH015]
MTTTLTERAGVDAEDGWRVPVTEVTQSDKSIRGSAEAQPRDFILTLFGLYARSERNWLSVAAVIELMGDLGVPGPLVRKSVSRLKQRGVLLSNRMGSDAGYSLSDQTLEVLAEGDVRIFDRSRSVVEDGWVLVVFSIPETERDKRHVMRTTLTRLGFGMVGQGVWIAPGGLEAELRRALLRQQMTRYVDVFGADHLAFGNLRARVRSWWNLDELSALYGDFIARHRPLMRQFDAVIAPREAYCTYVPVLTEWRRLPYLDPGLPLSLLPAGWNGVTADALFAEINALLSAPAREYAMGIIHR